MSPGGGAGPSLMNGWQVISRSDNGPRHRFDFDESEMQSSIRKLFAKSMLIALWHFANTQTSDQYIRVILFFSPYSFVKNLLNHPLEELARRAAPVDELRPWQRDGLLTMLRTLFMERRADHTVFAAKLSHRHTTFGLAQDRKGLGSAGSRHLHMNLLVHRSEKILLPQPLTFGGDYHGHGHRPPSPQHKAGTG